MNAQPYRVILTLLVLSVLSVLLLQAFWLRNFYRQKQDEFAKTIYSALENVSARLKEREGVRVIRNRISYDPAFKSDASLSGKPGTTNVYVQVHKEGKSSQAINTRRTELLKRTISSLSVTDSVVKVFDNGQKIVATRQVSSDGTGEDEMNRLMDKLITEIRIIDEEEKDQDTLKGLIKKVLAGKGLFLPFEFALKKVHKGKEQILTSTAGFDSASASFMSDLSANNVFSNHNFLFLQFPGESGYVFSSIKKMLILSLVFSFIIIGAFYYTIRLIINQKKLAEIKNDFVNNITHELKTPIATNSLAIDAIASPGIKNNDEKFKDYVRILKEENQKLNGHVERVLQMALLDKGDLPANSSRVDLVPVIEAAIDHHKLQISEQKAVVNFSPDSAVPPVLGDALQLQAVFANLIDNALKYSNGNCRIEILVRSNGNDVLVHVSDNGIGVEREHREKIFEKFYRARGGNLHDVKGFGLGLSYVRSVIEAHGGQVFLKSEKGKGAEFVIKLKAHV